MIKYITAVADLISFGKNWDKIVTGLKNIKKITLWTLSGFVVV